MFVLMATATAADPLDSTCRSGETDARPEKVMTMSEGRKDSRTERDAQADRQRDRETGGQVDSLT